MKRPYKKPRLYRLVFVREDELPAGAEIVTDPVRRKEMEDWYQKLRSQIETYGPTTERNVLVKILINDNPETDGEKNGQ